MSGLTRRPGQGGRRLRDAPTTSRVAADLICRIDADGIVRDASGGGPELPWSPAELAGRSLASLFPPAPAREVLSALNTLGRGPTATAIQFALPPGSGASHVEVRIAAEAAEETLRVVIRDIGPERQALVALTSNGAFLRQVLDLDPNLIFAKDRDGRFTLANRAVAAIYGVTASELVGKTDADFNPDGAEIEHFRADDREVMDSLRPKLIEKEPVTSPDGGTRWFQTIKIPIVSQDGRANAVLGVSADITARKQAEDHLERRSEQLLRHQNALRALALSPPADLKTTLERILRTSSRTLQVERAGVWLLDGEMKSLRAECVFDRGALLDEPTRVFLASEHPAYFRALAEERIVAAGDVRADPRTRELDTAYLAPMGITSMLDVTILSHGTVIGAVCHEHRGPRRSFTIEEQDFAASIADIVSLALEGSKRLALEEQLRHAQKMEAIGLLAGGISHDFNNILNIILGYAELAVQALPTDHPAASHLDNITSACVRAAELVRKILTFSRGQVLRVEPVDFGAVVREFSSLLTRVLGEDVELSVTCDEGAMVVDADRTQLEQILLNLCTNARQAMPHGGRMDLDARLACLGPGDSEPHVHLRVTDTGHGIDETTMSRLWEPFFTTKTEGTGLGLSMVYGIVRQHGGLLRAESRVGHGSTFHVLLPLRREPIAQPAADGATQSLRGRETILLAEDEALIRDLVKDSLGELGYKVLAAENGAEAVSLLAQDPGLIDLVILDVVMPKLSGPEALARMLKTKPDLKALFISGHAPESTQLAAHLGTAGRAFIPKPFLLETLAAKVREILDVGR